MTPQQSRSALAAVTSSAVDEAVGLSRSFGGGPEVRRAAMLEAVPMVIAYYSDGSAALAADYYMDERVAQAASGSYVAAPMVLDRTVRIRRAVAWAADPMFEGGDFSSRLRQVVQSEVARPFRDTIRGNRLADSQAIGWRRITGGHGCGFCKMLADKGAVYSKETVYFASHDSCDCSSQPVFRGGDVGEEASVIQYMASKRRRTEAEKAEIRYWVAYYEGL